MFTQQGLCLQLFWHWDAEGISCSPLPLPMLSPCMDVGMASTDGRKWVDGWVDGRVMGVGNSALGSDTGGCWDRK